MLTDELLESAHGLSDGIVALRRAIHAEPELGLHTPKTMATRRVDNAMSNSFGFGGTNACLIVGKVD